MGNTFESLDPVTPLPLNDVQILTDGFDYQAWQTSNLPAYNQVGPLAVNNQGMYSHR
jgi:hypothetical protein